MKLRNRLRTGIVQDLKLYARNHEIYTTSAKNRYTKQDLGPRIAL
jgi:hypothetical protein